MHRLLVSYARRHLKSGLYNCNSEERLKFRKLHGDGTRDKSLDTVVDNISQSQLSQAMVNLDIILGIQ